jgi:hypothetical protein
VAFPYANNVEGITNGATITTSTGGGDNWSGININNNAITSDNAHPGQGTQAIKIVMNAAPSGSANFGWNQSLTECWGQFKIYRTAYPVSTRIQEALNIQEAGVAVRATLQIDPTGGITVADGAGTHSGTMATALPLNAVNRIEFHFVASATTGLLEARLYNADSTTLLDSTTTTAGANTGAVATYVLFGNNTASDHGGTSWLDDFKLNNTDWPTSVVTPPADTYVLVPPQIYR